MPWSRSFPDRSQFEEACREAGCELRGLTYREAIREALSQTMAADESVFVLGEGVDDPGGIFGTTVGLHREFGPERSFDTPIAENAMTGMAAGAAMAGMKPVIVHMRMDFLYLAMDPLLNHAAKWRDMFAGRVNVSLTVMTIIGRGWGSAAQHSQSLQALFAHVPGLKVVMPYSPQDAKGLLCAAIDDPDPVIFIEHRYLFEHLGFVPEERYITPIGQAVVRREGSDVTVVAVSEMVAQAVKAAAVMQGEGISVEVIDLRTVKPLDEAAILGSVGKTGRLVIADTAWKSFGIGAEITARVAERDPAMLKAPVRRVSSPDVSAPCSEPLERAFYPGEAEIVAACREVCS